MSTRDAIRTFLWNSARDAQRTLRGKPLALVPLAGATLDRRDVAIASAWRDRPDRWLDPEPVRAYERAFARWNASRHAFAFGKGRVALSGIISAMGLGPGDEVIIPGFTCVVVPNAFRFAGVTVRFADIELDTYGPSVDAIRRLVSARTKAVLVHHLFGLVCLDYDRILDLCHTRRIRVIEDCAHATGARYRGQRIGHFGDAAFYSSEHSKVFSTVQGGMATTNDPELARGLAEFQRSSSPLDPGTLSRLLRTCRKDYLTNAHPHRALIRHPAALCMSSSAVASTTADEVRGNRPDNYRLSLAAPLAELGLSQLSKLDSLNARRRRQAAKWREWAEERGYGAPWIAPESEPVFLRYPLTVPAAVKRRPRVIEEELGVECGVWFTSPLHPSPERVEGCPNAYTAVETCVNLPCLVPE
ncbi:MAG: DegT/DnrJ/EryC1/StrS family aminotransferase [Sandaracinaceae bacterium]